MLISTFRAERSRDRMPQALRHPDQIGERIGEHLAHDVAAMKLHDVLSQFQFVRNLLIQQAGNDLPRRPGLVADLLPFAKPWRRTASDRIVYGWGRNAAARTAEFWIWLATLLRREYKRHPHKTRRGAGTRCACDLPGGALLAPVAHRPARRHMPKPRRNFGMEHRPSACIPLSFKGPCANRVGRRFALPLSMNGTRDWQLRKSSSSAPGIRGSGGRRRHGFRTRRASLPAH